MALTALVLAGGAADAVAAVQPGATNKSFVRIGGRPMVARVIDAVRGIAGLGRIVAVAPAITLEDAALAGADERRASGASIGESLAAAVAGFPPDEALLVCTSDAPLLTPRALEAFVAAAEARTLDIAYAIVERRLHESRFPDVPHTWARLRDGTFCGGAAVMLRPRVLPALDRFLARLAAARKSPIRLATLFGPDMLARFALGRLSIAQAEARAGRLLGAQAGAIVCADPAIAFNVDRPGDVALAEFYLARTTSNV